MAPIAGSERIRDAERSRRLLLEAAEQAFARRGYEGTSMAAIGSAAGLSRGAPGFFFRSKEQLYDEVMRRAFAGRQAAAERAFEPVRRWCETDGGSEQLRLVLGEAARDYLRFLLDHPSFVSLIMREQLDHGRHIGDSSAGSTAMRDAFSAVRRVGGSRGVACFDTEQAILVFVTLTFGAVSYSDTLLQALEVDLSAGAALDRHAELVADQLMLLIAPLSVPGRSGSASRRRPSR